MKCVKSIASLAFVMATLAPGAVTANSLTFQNVTFEMLASGNVLTLNIYNAPGANGGWFGIQSLASFEVKNVNTTNGLVTDTNTGRAWVYAAGGVNNGGAVGCGGGDTASSCFNAKLDANDANLNPAGLSNTMSWEITYGAPVDLSAPSLKVMFLDGSGAKQGSLLSAVVPVPEPEIYAMMGVGLALLGWMGRRNKLAQTARA